MGRCDCPPDNCPRRISDFLSGDSTAGDRLVDKFQPLVGAVVQRRLFSHGPEAVDDCRQAVWLRILEKLHLWTGQGKFCKWLQVLAARLAVDFGRATSRRTHVELAFDPIRDAVPAETIARLRQGVEQLPPELREVAELSLRGAPVAEMAGRLGKSVRTIQYYLSDMRCRLKHFL